MQKFDRFSAALWGLWVLFCLCFHAPSCIAFLVVQLLPHLSRFPITSGVCHHVSFDSVFIQRSCVLCRMSCSVSAPLISSRRLSLLLLRQLFLLFCKNKYIFLIFSFESLASTVQHLKQNMSCTLLAGDHVIACASTPVHVHISFCQQNIS